MTHKKLIDLTHPIEEGMLTFEATWHPRVSIQQLGRFGLEGRESRKLVVGTHTGTHIDAPLHFIKGGAGIEKTDLRTLIGPVTIVDFRHLKGGECVTVRMLERVRLAPRMIFRFGWGRHWGSRKFYHGYPFVSVEAARYLIKKKVRLLGYDTPSPDDSGIHLTKDVLGSPDDSPVHKLFLSHGVILVEYLANLESLKELRGWHIVALPLKITGADGSPARVLLYKWGARSAP